MKELALKYGCNPNQKPARIFMTEGELPIEVLNGKPGYINFCDAFNSWQLVRALKKATGLPAAASFKHVSPAGAALGKPLTDIEKQMYFVDTDKELSPIACAYIRARGKTVRKTGADAACASAPAASRKERNGVYGTAYHRRGHRRRGAVVGELSVTGK